MSMSDSAVSVRYALAIKDLEMGDYPTTSASRFPALDGGMRWSQESLRKRRRCKDENRHCRGYSVGSEDRGKTTRQGIQGLWQQVPEEGFSQKPQGHLRFGSGTGLLTSRTR